MNRPQTLRRYILKMQSLVALTVVLSYTIVISFYFIVGLNEANFQDLHLESNAFSHAYNNKEAVELPDSIHFKGYLGWQELPQRVKGIFPHLINVSSLEMEKIRIFSQDTFVPWPEQAIFIIAQPLNDGQIFYLIREINIEQYDALSQSGIIKMFSLTVPIALLVLVMMHIVVHLLLKRTLKPVRQLGDWVDTLTIDNVTKAVPSFEFNELNRIANQQQAALIRISEMLDKEQDFLRHASHELRTPIAVVKSNSELLARILENAGISETCDHKGVAAIARIKRAALNMQHTTETLLWLSREQGDSLVTSEVNVTAMINHLVDDNHYLLQGKKVSISLNIDNETLQLAETPCRLVLNNLIRNAFQYTAEGEVVISFHQAKVNIININQSQESLDHTAADYGYGLGLRLVARIVDKMSWQYQNNEIDGGRNVTVDFGTQL
ncbi:MAG: HAMP domain-containing histidine kinase [Colwellia sp.]|nr:HAMP domain-containing histidine kinase [Colwellia sp.]